MDTPKLQGPVEDTIFFKQKKQGLGVHLSQDLWRRYFQSSWDSLFTELQFLG